MPTSTRTKGRLRGAAGARDSRVLEKRGVRGRSGRVRPRGNPDIASGSPRVSASFLREVTLWWSSRFPLEEVSLPFLQGMLNRMQVGYLRYGPLSKNPRAPLSYLDGALRRYRATGNTEILIDIANYAMGEFTHPRHPRAHYEALDQGARVQPLVQHFRNQGKGG